MEKSQSGRGRIKVYVPLKGTLLKIFLLDPSLTCQLCCKQITSPFLNHPGQIRWWIMNANAALAEMLPQLYTAKAHCLPLCSQLPRHLLKIMALFITKRKNSFFKISFKNFIFSFQASLLVFFFPIDSIQFCCSCYINTVLVGTKETWNFFFPLWELTRAVATFLSQGSWKKKCLNKAELFWFYSFATIAIYSAI